MTAALAQMSGYPSLMDAWQAAETWGKGTILALLIATHGPAYRNAGTAMAISKDGQIAGAITSGCIEADLVLQAQAVRQSKKPLILRYGQGSPFIDLRLPCGGAIEVMLFEVAEPAILTVLNRSREERIAVTLSVSAEGLLSLSHDPAHAPSKSCHSLHFPPPLRFLIFGTGAEAVTFAALCSGLGYETQLLSPEESSILQAQARGLNAQHVTHAHRLSELRVDAATAIVLFYHDHDFEPEILRFALRTPAFFIGAQGSRSAQARRLEHLAELGVAAEDLQRLRGPIGVTPSTRDPRSLAISALAEIMALSSDHTQPNFRRRV